MKTLTMEEIIKEIERLKKEEEEYCRRYMELNPTDERRKNQSLAIKNVLYMVLQALDVVKERD